MIWTASTTIINHREKPMLITWTERPVEGTTIMMSVPDASIGIIVSEAGGEIIVEGPREGVKINVSREVAQAAQAIMSAYVARCSYPGDGPADAHMDACTAVVFNDVSYQHHCPMFLDQKGQPITLSVDLLLEHARSVVATVAHNAAVKLRTAKIKRILTEAYNLAFDRNFRVAGSMVVIPEGQAMSPSTIADEMLLDAFPEEERIRVEKTLEGKGLKRLRDLYRNWETFDHARFMIQHTANIIDDEEQA